MSTHDIIKDKYVINFLFSLGGKKEYQKNFYSQPYKEENYAIAY